MIIKKATNWSPFLLVAIEPIESYRNYSAMIIDYFTTTLVVALADLTM